ncbi:MAG: M61 family metallopeptidase [Planctomycetota bacterium]
MSMPLASRQVSAQESARAAAPFRYVVRIAEPHTHYLHVDASFNELKGENAEFFMAVWTPGSYLVREYARHVEELRAHTLSGAEFAIEKVAKNRWRVANVPADGAIRLTYRVYGRELSVRTNWVEENFALLNGAPTIITLADAAPRAHEVRLELPPYWRGSWTGLPPHPSGAPNHYLAPDLDTLIDCPILCGNPTVHEFEVSGIRHFLVDEGAGGSWDGARAAQDVARIVAKQHELWRDVPYDSYYFLNLLTETGGGLEHKNSTVLMTSAWKRNPDDYHGWLGLASHEFFHTWNVKRLRPIELGPFDYERESYTSLLWVAEGFTSYYDDLLVMRAGLLKREQYLKALSKTINDLQTTPGRLVHPLGMSSFDSWIIYYRRDENTNNRSISYYTKGAVVGFLLDAKIRQLTSDQRSLDDVMRRAYERFSGAVGYTESDIYAVCSEVAGADLSDWLRDAVETTKELDYREALDWLGLRFKDPDKKKKDESANGASPSDDEPKPGWLGITTRTDGGRLVVSSVKRATPGYDAGINVEDEIIAIEDYRVTPDGFEARLKQYAPGTAVAILVARRTRLMTLRATFGEKPKDLWTLEVHPDATAEQKLHLRSWLHESAPPPPTTK